MGDSSRIASACDLILCADARAPHCAVIAYREPVAIIIWLALAGALYFALVALKRRGPGDVGFAVTTLIAAFSLLDALLIAGQHQLGIALLASLGFPLTLGLQRYVRGT